jgi:hypothetical protein
MWFLGTDEALQSEPEQAGLLSFPSAVGWTSKL